MLLYGVSTVYSIFLLRRGFRQDTRVNYLLLAAGFALHTLAMFKRGFSLQRCPVNNLYEAITFVEWTILAAYMVFGAWSRLRFFGAFASPILFALGVFALMPALDQHHGPKPDFSGGMLQLHITLILLSYGAFGLSTVAALMYLSQEHDLKFHKMRAVLSLMPPIQRLEVVIWRALFGGFILLTVGIFVGAAFLEPPKNMGFWEDPKVIWSLFVWTLYLVLLVSRWRFAQRGRRFAWGAIGGFTFVMLTFWGVKLLSAMHNQ